MKTSRFTKKFAAALAPIAFAGAMMAPTASASTPASAHSPAATARAKAPRAHAKVGLSQGFLIHNYTGQALTLDNITGSGNFEGRPADGSVFNPASVHDIEVQYKFLETQFDVAHYHFANGATATVSMAVDEYNSPSVIGCETSNGDGTCTYDGKNVYLLDPPGTVNNLNADQKQAQAQVLKQLCDASTAATCQFTPTKEDTNAFSAEHQVGNDIKNHGNETDKTDLEWQDTVEVTNSYEVSGSVGVNLFHIVEASVDAQYGHEVTNSHEFKQTLELDVDPGYRGWVTDVAPVIRDWGNFTVTMGNTTWNLTDVYFDTPDPSRNGSFATYTEKM